MLRYTFLVFPIKSGLEAIIIFYVIVRREINPSNAEATWNHPKHEDAKIFEKHLNPIMFIFIGELWLSTFWWVPMCQGFNQFCIGQISHQQHKG